MNLILLRACADPFWRNLLYNVTRRRFIALASRPDAEAFKRRLLAKLPLDIANVLRDRQLENWPIVMAQIERYINDPSSVA